MIALRKRTREQLRHDRAVVRQQAAARIDPTDPAWRARNQRQAAQIRRKALDDG